MPHWPSKLSQFLNWLNIFFFGIKFRKVYLVKHQILMFLLLPDSGTWEVHWCWKSKLWKGEKSSHWSQNTVAGQIFQLVIKIKRKSCVSPCKNTKWFSGKLPFSYYAYISYSLLIGRIFFDGKNHGFWAMSPLPSQA